MSPRTPNPIVSQVEPCQLSRLQAQFAHGLAIMQDVVQDSSCQLSRFQAQFAQERDTRGGSWRLPECRHVE